MERIGEKLRRRREELGLTLEDVSEAIRFRPEVIRAIEEGRTSVFPAKAYLSAFLRAYAVILELDPREIVREQKSEEERAFEAIRNIRMKPKRRRKFPRKVLYIAIPIVLAAALLFVVDRFLWDREPGIPGGPVEEPRGAVPAAAGSAQDTTGSGSGDAADTESAGAGDAAGDVEETPTPSPATPEQDASEEGVRNSEPTGGADPGEEARSNESAGEQISGGGAARDVARADDAVETTPAETGSGAAPEEALVPLAVESETADPGDDRGNVPEAPGGNAADRDHAAPAAGGAGEAREPAVPAADAEAVPGAETETVSVADSGTEPEAADEAEPGRRRHKLVVSARRTAYITLSTGDRNLHDDLFTGGQVDSFFSETPFVINFLTDRGAWTFVQDGERVRLPGSSSEDVSDFEIPLPSGD